MKFCWGTLKNVIVFYALLLSFSLLSGSNSFLIQNSSNKVYRESQTVKTSLVYSLLSVNSKRRGVHLHLASENEVHTDIPGNEGPVNSCREKIKEALSPKELIVTSAHDDPNGSHIAVKVVSTMFEGKNRVQRQQLVYKAIWEEMQGAIHAVDQLICKTPEENISSPQNLGEY